MDGPAPAKRPRLGEDATLSPGLARAPLLRGPPPGEPPTPGDPGGEPGGGRARAPPKRKRPPRGARGQQEGPSPKTPRRARARAGRPPGGGGLLLPRLIPRSIGGAGATRPRGQPPAESAPTLGPGAAPPSRGREAGRRPRRTRGAAPRPGPPPGVTREGASARRAEQRGAPPRRPAGSASRPAAAGKRGPSTCSPPPRPPACGAASPARACPARACPARACPAALAARTPQRAFPEGRHPADCSPRLRSRAAPRGPPGAALAREGVAGLPLRAAGPRNTNLDRKFREVQNADGPPFLSGENGAQSGAAKPRSDPAHGDNLLLTMFKTSNCSFNLNIKYRLEVRECRNPKEGNCISKGLLLCHIITTENMPRDLRKSLHKCFPLIPKDTFFSIFDTNETFSLLSNFGAVGNISLAKRDYNKNESFEKAINMEAVDALTIRRIPQFIQDNKIHLTERLHKINTSTQDTAIEKTQRLNIGSFNFKGKFNCFLDIDEQVKLVNYDTLNIGPNTMAFIQENFVGCFLGEREEKIQDLIWKEKKHPTESLQLGHRYQIYNVTKTESKQKSHIAITDTIVCILKSNLLMKKKPNLVDAREINQIYGNQNNTAARNEHQTILQESALANSRLFHPKNESTEFVNHKFKTNLTTKNNEHSLDPPAECLSTETKTISDFEMKSEFDIVLKELCMFHEIGKEETSCLRETGNEEKNYFNKDDSNEDMKQEIREDLKVVTAEKTDTPSSPCGTITAVNVLKRVQSSFKWKKLHKEDGDQEVPREYRSSSPSADKLLYSSSGEDFENVLSQNLALFSDAFTEGRLHSLLKGGSSVSHGIVRIQPLQTCRGPIRIGLSRKAKAKQLHPYLK